MLIVGIFTLFSIQELQFNLFRGLYRHSKFRVFIRNLLKIFHLSALKIKEKSLFFHLSFHLNEKTVTYRLSIHNLDY